MHLLKGINNIDHTIELILKADPPKKTSQQEVKEAKA